MQFPSIAGARKEAQLPIPSERGTFERCKLDFAERERFRHIYDLHRDLLRLRREDARFSEQKPAGVDGAVLAPEIFVLRYFGDGGDDRLLIVNLGKETQLRIVPEPLLAPPLGIEWQVIWTSQSPRYGGPGATDVTATKRWTFPAEAAVVMRPRRNGVSTERPLERVKIE